MGSGLSHHECPACHFAVNVDRVDRCPKCASWLVDWRDVLRIHEEMTEALKRGERVEGLGDMTLAEATKPIGKAKPPLNRAEAKRQVDRGWELLNLGRDPQLATQRFMRGLGSPEIDPETQERARAGLKHINTGRYHPAAEPRPTAGELGSPARTGVCPFCGAGRELAAAGGIGLFPIHGGSTGSIAYVCEECCQRGWDEDPYFWRWFWDENG